jgi:hypothetical protein
MHGVIRMEEREKIRGKLVKFLSILVRSHLFSGKQGYDMTYY